MKHNAKRLFHSSIRIAGEKNVYIDPWQIAGQPHDADLILVTHGHHDHYSPEDIAKISRPDTVLAVPASMTESVEQEAQRVEPGNTYILAGVPVETVAAYNVGRPFHPKENQNVGYVVTLGGIRYFIAGDTDKIPENEAVRCDVALLPVGGKYTMDACQAAELANVIHPGTAIPTHYGTVTDSADAGRIFAAALDADIEGEIQE